jgi:hypothetical protein
VLMKKSIPLLRWSWRGGVGEEELVVRGRRRRVQVQVMRRHCVLRQQQLVTRRWKAQPELIGLLIHQVLALSRPRDRGGSKAPKWKYQGVDS